MEFKVYSIAEEQTIKNKGFFRKDMYNNILIKEER